MLRRLNDMFWLPYGLCFRHRHKLSHLPPFGTATRLGFLMVLAILAAWRLGVDFAKISSWVERLVLGSVIGLTFSDAVHCVMDVVSTMWKRTRRKLQRRTK